MLAIEVYVFLFTTFLLFVVLFYKFIFLLFKPFVIFFSFLKREYYKIFSLNKIKNNILWEEKKEKVNITIESNINKNEKLIKSKIEKLFLKVQVAKQKWDIDLLERNLVEILSIDENNIRALEFLSSLYINLWKTKKAFPLLKRLIQIDTWNDNAIWNLAKLYLDFWEPQTAKILIEKVISLNEKNHKYYVTYADILYNLSDIPWSIKAIEKALELKPKNIIYLEALASLYEELWEDGKSKAYRLEILDLEPDYEKAKEKLKFKD